MNSTTDWFDTGSVQWMSRPGGFDRDGIAGVYDAAAFTHLAGGNSLPLMWGHDWGLPAD